VDYSILKTELTADPLGRGYATMSDAEAAASLNTANRALVSLKMVQYRTMMADIGVEATRAIMTAMAAAGQTDTVVALVDLWLKDPKSEGVDMGHANTRAVIDDLVTAGSITAAQAAGVKAMAESTVSRATELGLPTILPGYIAKARK
jgi:hypothetical protein